MDSKKTSNWQKRRIELSQEYQNLALEIGLNALVIEKREGKRLLLDDGRELVEFVSCSYLGLENDPTLFSFEEQSVESYETNTRASELEEAMLNLENIAKKNGCKSGFWRRIQKVAVQLKLNEKAEEYEREFHSALSNKST